jgi:polysaccharide export outer membrane protein
MPNQKGQETSVRVVFTLICAVGSVFAQTAPSGAVAEVSLPSTPAEPSPGLAVEGEAPKSGTSRTTPTVPGPVAEPSAQGAVPGASISRNRPAARPLEEKAQTQAATSGRKPYVFGVNDVIIVKIWNQPNLSGAFPVGTDGFLSIPIVGDVKAEGRSAKQVTADVIDHLRECCVNNPDGEVDVQLGKNNSKRYYIYGGVGRGGEFTLDRDDFTILDAMAIVGGFKEFANTKKIYLLRGALRFPFNYKEAIQGKHLEQNIVIQNGDRIFVPE